MFDPGAQETLADAQEAMRVHTLLRAGRPCAVFVDMRHLKSQDRDARQFYGSPDIAHAAPAVALLVGSRVSQLIANFFISVTKTSVPTRLFTDESEALAWLKGFQA
jgi:hypothetical protein